MSLVTHLFLMEWIKTYTVSHYKERFSELCLLLPEAFSTLKIYAADPSTELVAIAQTTWRRIPDDP
jgi:hypothetical protein